MRATAITPASELLERDLQRNVIALLKLRGWRVAFTWSSIHSPKGFPDLVCIRRGEMLAIECKRERGKTTPEQDAWLADFALVPGVRWAGVLRPSMWLDGFLDGVVT